MLRWYVGGLMLVALGLLGLTARKAVQGVAPSVWLAFAGLLVLCAVAHFYPFEYAVGGAKRTGSRQSWSEALLGCGLVLLPPALLPLLAGCSWLPWLIRYGAHSRRRIGGLFNFAQYTTGAALAALLVEATGSGLWQWAVGICTFVLVQHVLVAVVIALDTGVPLRQVRAVDQITLLSELQMFWVGVAAGLLTRVDVLAIALVIPTCLALHRFRARLYEVQYTFVEPKTGLGNHRAFDERYALSYARALQTGRPLSVVFGDMDHLREINNTFGHQVGDQALLAVARCFEEVARPGDFVGRFGGEEFVLLLPGTDKRTACRLAESLRLRVAEHAVGGPGTARSLSISLGVATFPEDAQHPKALLDLADQAVYQAKAAGRNRVVACGPPALEGWGRAPASPQTV